MPSTPEATILPFMPRHTPRASLALLALAIGLSGLLLVRRLATVSSPGGRDAASPAPSAAESRLPNPAPEGRADAALPAAPLKPPRAAAPSSAAIPAASGADNRANKVRVDAAGFRSLVPLGGALVTGGWSTPHGQRVLAVASPMATGDEGQLKVATQIVAIPEALLGDPGWAPLLAGSDRKLRLEGGVFDASELAAFRDQLATNKGVDVLSAPWLVMKYDQVGSVQISGVQGGLMMSVVASKPAGTEDVELAVTMAQYGEAKDPQPR